MHGTKRVVRGLLTHMTAIAVAALVAWLAWERPSLAGSLERVARNIAWTRATAYASLTLLCLALSIGPLARLWPRGFGRLVPFRRAAGVWSAVTAGAHFWFAFQGYGAGDPLNMLFYGGQRLYVAFGAPAAGPISPPRWMPNLVTTAGIAYWLGLFALAILAVLALISNDRAQRALGATWKFVQQQGYLAFALVLAHFAIVYFNPFKGSLPKEKIAFSAFLAVAALQAAGFARTAWRRRPQAAGRAQATVGSEEAKGSQEAAGDREAALDREAAAGSQEAHGAAAANVREPADAVGVWSAREMLSLMGSVRRVRVKRARLRRKTPAR